MWAQSSGEPELLGMGPVSGQQEDWGQVGASAPEREPLKGGGWQRPSRSMEGISSGLGMAMAAIWALPSWPGARGRPVQSSCPGLICMVVWVCGPSQP